MIPQSPKEDRSEKHVELHQWTSGAELPEARWGETPKGGGSALDGRVPLHGGPCLRLKSGGLEARCRLEDPEDER